MFFITKKMPKKQEIFTFKVAEIEAEISEKRSQALALLLRARASMIWKKKSVRAEFFGDASAG